MFFYLSFSLITIWLVVLGWYDCCCRLLPNYLTLGGTAVLLITRLVLTGTDGMLNGLLGGVVGFLFLLIPAILHGVGDGDLKMFLAVGCLVGYPGIFLVMFLASVFGLILGFGMLLAGKVDGSVMKHWLLCCVKWNYDRAAGREVLRRNKDKRKAGIPFGIAIAAGTWCTIALNEYMRSTGALQ